MNSRPDSKDKNYPDNFEAHLQILQSIISRFSANSANCKVCAISIAAALVALDFNNLHVNPVFGICIVVLLLLTDAYYLGFEREYIKAYREDVEHPENAALFKMPELSFCDQIDEMLYGLWSLSTTPFYAILALIIWIFI